MKKGNDVRVAGVPVGEVTGIHPDFQTGQVIITFEVDDGTDLGPQTRAEIAAATLLGGYYLRLSGPVEKPYLESLPTDDARRRIPLERTNAPVSLIGALSDTTTQIQTIDIDAVNAVLRDLAGATDRNADVVPTLIDNLTTVGAAISSREDELRDLVGNASDLSDVLADRDQEILTLVDAASVLLERLQERRDELATILGSGSQAVVTLTETITQHRADIDALLADAQVLLDGIERNTSTINTSLGWAGPIFGLLDATLADEGGFNVGVEGFIGTTDQLKALLGILIPGVET
jgi:phospholipid/cholesterol/gamma-HCH transport system substrate-binding protein